jgi:hypothetical protein
VTGRVVGNSKVMAEVALGPGKLTGELSPPDVSFYPK